jgi:hypothetical protein
MTREANKLICVYESSVVHSVGKYSLMNALIHVIFKHE